MQYEAGCRDVSGEGFDREGNMAAHDETSEPDHYRWRGRECSLEADSMYDLIREAGLFSFLVVRYPDVNTFVLEFRVGLADVVPCATGGIQLWVD